MVFLSSGVQAVDSPIVARQSPVSILLIDDNAAKRLAMMAILAPLGYRIVEADSGRAALRCLMIEDFAVILLDVFMPTMSGFDTAALIRLRQQSEMTPIIFVTASSASQTVGTDRYVGGAVDFMLAPVQPDELRAKVSVFANLFINAQQLATSAKEVQISADHLRFLTESAPIGIFQTDRQGRHVYTNPRWSDITGIPAGDAVGHDWGSVMRSDRPVELVSEVAVDASGSEEGVEQSRRFHLCEPGSARRIVRETSKPIPDPDGGIAGWIGTLADVTTEVETELTITHARAKVDEASQLKSNLLSTMSHEIRTPMNGVLDMADLLLETDLDARQRGYAEAVRDSGQELLIVINRDQAE